MGLFERYLTLWVALCIVAGTLLGHALPQPFAALASAEVAKVNLPIAVLIWLMIIPMLLLAELVHRTEINPQQHRDDHQPDQHRDGQVDLGHLR